MLLYLVKTIIYICGVYFYSVIVMILTKPDKMIKFVMSLVYLTFSTICALDQ